MTEAPLAVARRIDPERLALLLEQAGWQLVGLRHGSYRRYACRGMTAGVTPS